MRSIRLSDASFAKNLIGKYGWSVGRSTNRRGSMIYRMEQKPQQFSSTPLHIDVHIRQIRSILNMYSLNASRASKRQQLIDGRVIEGRAIEGRLIQDAKGNASVKPVGGLKVIHQLGKSNVINQIIVREQSIGRSEQLMSNQSEHPDFIEAFHPSSLKQARAIRNDLALTLNQVNHWIRNQTWRSQTVMQRLNSPEPIVNHSLSLTTNEYMQSTHSHLQQIRVAGESRETLIVINRKQPPMQMTMLRSRLAVEQVRQLFAALPHTGVDPQRDQVVSRRPHIDQRKLNSISYRSPIVSRQMIHVTQNLDTQRVDLKESNETQVGQQRAKPTQLNVRPSVQQLVERVIGQSAKPSVQPSTQQSVQHMIQQLMVATTQSVSVMLPGIVTNRYFDQSVQRNIPLIRGQDSDMPQPLVHTVSRILGITADKGNRVMTSIREIVRQEKARVIQQSETIIQQLASKQQQGASQIQQENNRLVEPRTGLRTELQTGLQAVSSKTVVQNQAQFYLIERLLRHVQLDQQKLNVDSLLRIGSKAIERNRVEIRTGILNHKIINVSKLTTNTSLQHHNHTINQNQAHLTEQSVRIQNMTQNKMMNVQLNRRMVSRLHNKIVNMSKLTTNTSMQHTHTINKGQTTIQSRAVNLSQEQRQAAQVHVSQRDVAQAQNAQSSAPGQQPVQANNKAPNSSQNQINKENKIEQHLTEQNVRIQNMTQNQMTNLQVGRQLVSRISKQEQRTMSHSHQRTLMTINRMNKAQSMTLKSNLIIARTQIRELTDEGQMTTGARTGTSTARSGLGMQGSTIPLIVASGQADRQPAGRPPVVIRGQTNQQAVSMDVPVKKTVLPNKDEPVIRSLEYAIKTIEQDLNQAKEEWAQPKLDINRLADQMFKDFSKRMRHEQQRRGI